MADNGNGNGRGKLHDPLNWAMTIGGFIGLFGAYIQTNIQAGQRSDETNTKVERLMERIDGDERRLVDATTAAERMTVQGDTDSRRELDGLYKRIDDLDKGKQSKEAADYLSNMAVQRFTQIEKQIDEMEAILRPLRDGVARP